MDFRYPQPIAPPQACFTEIQLPGRHRTNMLESGFESHFTNAGAVIRRRYRADQLVTPGNGKAAIGESQSVAVAGGETVGEEPGEAAGAGGMPGKVSISGRRL
ncbi:hypothetical protein GCM10009525_39950 [Streptosporangium amethystogenes subsp. fukuiense]